MNYRINDRIVLLERMNDEFYDGVYRGVEVDEEGTISKIDKIGEDYILQIIWDSGRTLNVILPYDKIKKIG